MEAWGGKGRPRGEEEFAALAEAGVGLLVSLLEAGVEHYTAPPGFRLVRLPIDDGAAPADEHRPHVRRVCAFIHAYRCQGSGRRSVLVHCHGGLGRTGLMLACARAWLRATDPEDPDGQTARETAREVQRQIIGTHGIAVPGPGRGQTLFAERFGEWVARTPDGGEADRARAELEWHAFQGDGAPAGGAGTFECDLCGAVAWVPGPGHRTGPLWCPTCGMPTGIGSP